MRIIYKLNFITRSHESCGRLINKRVQQIARLNWPTARGISSAVAESFD